MTKKEAVILADIRNLYGPILSYFNLRGEIQNGDLRPEQKVDLLTLLDAEDGKAQENVIKVAQLLKKFG